MIASNNSAEAVMLKIWLWGLRLLTVIALALAGASLYKGFVFAGALFALSAWLFWPSVGERIAEINGAKWFAPSMAMIGLVLGGPLSVVAYMSEEPEHQEVAARDCTDSGMAYIMSRGFVKRSLTDPDSAKFPSGNAREVTSNQSGKCKFAVSAYVDAKNAIGGTVRSRYSIDMEYLPDEKVWRGSALVMH